MKDNTGARTLLRSNRLLLKKFRQFLLPTMITCAAIALNEFVDSMLVSRLLGSSSMAIVALGMPLMLVIAALYGLLGNGGATVYAIALGRRDHDKAGEALSAALLASVSAGLLLFALGLIFFSPLSKLLCTDAGLRPEFESYLRILLFSAPLLTLILSFASFLPSAGNPGLATAVNVTANGVNLIMDYVYIRVLHMGVEGAAWATLTGYLCAGAVLILALLSRRLRLFLCCSPVRSLGTLPEVFRLGGPDAMTQVGLCLQFVVCNNLAMSRGGVDAVVALTLSQQTISVLSVFIGTVIGSSSPILAVLHGQRDYQGESSILRLSLQGVLLLASVGTLLFEVFAPWTTAFYKIIEPGQAVLTVHAMRIFVLMHIPRYLLNTYCRYLKLIGQAGYATLVSALIDFGAILPMAWLLTWLLGLDGLWMAFPLTSYLLFLFVIVWNRRLAALSGGRLKGLLLLEHDEEAEPIIDVTITKNSEEISQLSERLRKVCEDQGLNRTDAVRAALAVEEICVYAANKKTQDSFMDVLVRLFKGNVEIEFRSLGVAIDPMVDVEEDLQVNLRVLRSVAKSIENEYVLGMNSLRLVIDTREEKHWEQTT